MPRSVNLIMKIDNPKKQMLDITMIFLWADDYVVKHSIDKASVWKDEQND